MVTAPKITITMAITMAKTGRSMKNFAMIDSVLRGASARHRLFFIGLRVDGDAGPSDQQAFDDNPVAGFKTLFDQPVIAYAGPRLHGVRFHYVGGVYGEHR